MTPKPKDKVRYYENGWRFGIVAQVKDGKVEIERPNRKPRQHRIWIELANVEIYK